jgi:hypothetical protein
MYNDVFGSSTVPPSQNTYLSLVLTGDVSFEWPWNSDSASLSVAKIIKVSGVAANLTLPSASEAGVGEDFLVQNVGANTVTLKDLGGNTVGTVSAGTAGYFYLSDNTTDNGQWSFIAFGAGASSVSAAQLIGYGIKALGASLNQSHPVALISTNTTVTSSHRASLLVNNGGNITLSLTAVATLGDDFFVFFRNAGSGTATIDPNGSEQIDGQSTITVQPGESLGLFCSGAEWYSVGYGRSTIYQFSQLVKDVSAGGTFTLSSAEVANKLLTFVGNPATPVTVNVPAVVSVYYVDSQLSTTQAITLKTSSGTGVSVPQSSRIIALCNGTNVVSAQSVQASTTISIVDGAAASPSLNFSSQTNTGLFKSGTGLGIAVAGSALVDVQSTGTTFNGTSPVVSAKIGPSTIQQHTIPAVSADTLALIAATQTLTNKTFNLTSNTLTGTLAQFNTALSDDNFVSLTGTETLTNKTLTTPTLTLKQSVSPTPTVNGDIQWDSDGFFLLVGNGLGQTTIPSVSSAHTLTNKTLDLTSNTLTGTLAQFNTACSDADFASLTGVETLTNKTLGTGSTWNGSVIGNVYGGTGQNSSAWSGIPKVSAGVWSLAAAGTDFLSPSTGVVKDSATGAAHMPSGTTGQRPGSPSFGDTRANSTTNAIEWWNGSSWTAMAILDASGKVPTAQLPALASETLFYKTDPTTVAFTKTGAGAATIKSGTKIVVGGTAITFASDTTITMPSLTSGTDYAIWVKDDATIQATTDFVSPPSAGNWRKIGGFHYAPGGNATAMSGGDATPAINAYSFWDLNFRPAAVDPRGMVLVADSFWADIYLLGVDHLTNGTSKYNVTIADGSSPPKIPAKFGGNGSTTYSTLTWWEANEVLQSWGKRSPTYDEFAALAYGTTEATSSGGSDVPTTGVSGTGATNPWNKFTSRWGVIQATGCMWVWGGNFGGGAASGWTANTGGRGSTYQMENVATFGCSWGYSTEPGSRCSSWNSSPTASYNSVGARGVCDHLIIN